ncbi:hypothetical protein DL765_004930 [Monosporascus sp. GIB2]|nr:hypothetical protein DL765_004930 [Monosporascus sp. GIB2]
MAIRSLNNGSLVEYDPYTSTTDIIEFPGVSHNSDFFVCGVDYSHATGTVYISASARAPWWPTIGANLSGPNRLIHYSPLEKSILWQANIDPLVAEVQQQTGTPFAGFQDSAEDKDGNAYFFGTFGNIIVKVDKNGQATKFYSPDPVNDKSYGFGGAFVTQENVLVLADAISDGFVRFDLSGPTPSQPTFTAPSGHPEIFKDVLECDALNAPRRYNDAVALCSNVLDRQFAPHGIITVYTSEDGWKTSKYVGMIPTELEPPDVWSTAQFATADRVYALSSSLPYDDGAFPQTESTTLVDITEKVDELVGKFAPNESSSETGQVHEEL